MRVLLRAPVLEDARAVLAVLHARDIADLGAPDDTFDDLLDEWKGSEFDLSADARVIEQDGRIVAYAVVRRPGTLAVVEPESEGRGIGARLLRWTEHREHEQGRRRHRQWVASSNDRARALLVSAGYERSRSYWRMTIRLEDIGERGGPPAGAQLRTLDVERDAEALFVLDAASFAAVPGTEPESFQAFREEHLSAHDLEPALSCVAEVDGTIAGFLLARRRPNDAVGFVDILAVHPDRQRRGLGTALLREAFVRFSAAGLEEAELGVASDNPGAVRLYEGLGMRPRFQFDTYERSVARGPAAD